MRRAFTLIELSVVIAVVAIFISAVLPNFLTPISRSTFSTTLSGLVSDIRYQQLTAIQGDPAISAGPGYFGIHFAADSYTLFSGQVYSPADPANRRTEISPNLNLTLINLPASEIIFAPGSGRAANFIAPAVTGDVTLYDLTTGQSAVIVINQYGVVSQIN